MLLSVEGQEKSGKTGFAYTAPLPIVGFQFDLGHDRAINGPLWDKYYNGLDIHVEKLSRLPGIPPVPQELWAGHDITIYELPQPIQLDSTDIVGYINLWNYFIALLGSALSDTDIRSIVLDTATVARGVKTNAYIEELNQRNPQNKRKQLLQIEYGHVNSAFENIYTIAKSVNKNFIALHHLRDEYRPQNIAGTIESVPSGKLELDGWNKTYRFVDTAIRNTFTSGIFESEIVVCGDSPSMTGTKMANMDWNMLVDLISMSLGGRVEYQKR
jgi:hypothetical protein